MDQEQLKELYRKSGLSGMVDMYAACGMELPPLGAAQPSPTKYKADLGTLEGWHPQAKKIEGFLAAVPGSNNQPNERMMSFSPRKIVSKIEPAPENDSYWNGEWGAMPIDPSFD